MSTQVLSKKKNTAYYVNSFIVILIMAVFWFIPPTAPLTPLGMKVLGTLLGAVYGWCTVDIAWPTFLAWISMAVNGFATGDKVIGGALSNSTVIYIIVLFLFAATFIATDTATLLAKKIINAKFTRGKPWNLTLAIMIAAYLPATVINGVSATVIIWSLIYAICKEVGIEKGDKWAAIMIIMSSVAANFGHVMLPFQFSNVATFGVLSSLDKSYRLPYGTFVFLSLIVSIIGIFACYFFMRYIVKPDVSKLQNYKCTEEIPAFNFSQKANMWLFVLLFILLMIPSLITTGPIFAFFNNLGNAASTCVVLVIALFLKDKEGNKVVEFSKLGTLVPWQLVFMISTSLFLASSFGDKSVGINSWLAGLFVPLFKGLSPVVLCIMILVVGLILTNALSNSVICATLIPILYACRSVLGYPMMMSTIIVFMGIINIGFLLPSGSSIGAMLFGNSEWVTPKQIYMYAGFATVVALAAYCIAFAIGCVIIK